MDATRDQSRQPTPAADDAAADVPAPTRDLDSGLWEDVKSLPPKQREAIGLRFIGDLSPAEIGDVMGTSEGAARRNVHEGLKQLRRRIKT